MTQAPASSPPPQIVARNLTKTYRMGDSVIGALQGINVEVERGEYLAVTGHSGSGKSTFMNLIGALDTLRCQATREIDAERQRPSGEDFVQTHLDRQAEAAKMPSPFGIA